MTKKKKTSARRLRRGASDDDVLRWATEHDVFERLDTGTSEIVDDHVDLDRLLEAAVFEENTAQLNMRLPPAMKAVLAKLARQRTTDTTTLARMWLAERIRLEMNRNPATSA